MSYLSYIHEYLQDKGIPPLGLKKRLTWPLSQNYLSEKWWSIDKEGQTKKIFWLLDLHHKNNGIFDFSTNVTFYSIYVLQNLIVKLLRVSVQWPPMRPHVINVTIFLLGLFVTPSASLSQPSVAFTFWLFLPAQAPHNIRFNHFAWPMHNQ